MRRFLAAMMIFALITVSAPLCASAFDRADETAADITASALIGYGENFDYSRMTDRKNTTYTVLPEGKTVTLSHSDGIYAIYVVFDTPCGEWNIAAGDTVRTLGKNRFIHEYVDVAALFGCAPECFEATFPNGASVSEIYILSDGDTPSWVQKWEPPCAAADLMIISAHSDDEHLFFAGLVPLYAAEYGCAVQVVYFTQSYDTHIRQHEQLDGLWEAGARNYPVVAEFPDLYSKSLEAALKVYGDAGYSEDDFIAFTVEQIRRFRPLVLVGHAEDGEYGHGTHILSAHAIKAATEAANDAERYPDSAKKYGAYDTPKTYLHMYGENKITVDIDIPLRAFDGRTAFAVSQTAFLTHHTSQDWTGMGEWISGTKAKPITMASQIKNNNPREYGLYRSQVGFDSGKNDIFENVITYAEQARIAAEEEAHRRAMESEKAAKSEAAVASRRAVSAAISAAESERAATLAAEDAKTHNRIMTAAVAAATGVCIVMIIVIAVKRKKQR